MTVCLTLAILLGSGMVFSAGSKEGDVEAASHSQYEKKIKVSLMHRLLFHNGQPLVEDDKVMEYLEDKFNVEFEIINVPAINHAKIFEIMQMMISTGEVPDIFEMKNGGALPVQIALSLIGHDKVTDIGQIVKDNPGRYPNIKKNLDHPHADAFRLVDGKLHMMPRDMRMWAHTWYARKDWMDKLGLSVPTNVDELYTYLKRSVAEDPDGKGNVGWTNGGTWMFNHLYTGFHGAKIWAVRDGKYIQARLTEGQKEGLKYMNRLYEEGLLDPDFPVLKSQIDDANKFASGRAALYVHALKSISKFGPQLRQYNPDSEAIILPLDLQGPKGMCRMSGLGFYEGIMVSSEVDDPLRCWDMIEFLKTEEGIELWDNGIEGVHFKKDAEGNVTWRNEELYKHELWGLEGLQPFHGIKMLVDHVNYRGADGYDPKLTDWFWSTAGKLKDIPTDPMWSWAPLEIALELGTPYEQIWQRYEPAFITGELDIDTYWDEFVQEFRKGVYEKIEDWVNSTYDPKDYALTYNPQW